MDSVLNDALHIVNRCLCSIPTNPLPVFSSIKPAEFCQLKAELFMTNSRTLDPDHPLQAIILTSEAAKMFIARLIFFILI